MRPNNIRQEAKSHTPISDENPDQLNVVLEIIENGDVHIGTLFLN
jgi:hypothetical protein